MIYWIAHFLWAFLSKIFFPIKVSGLKHLPKEGGFIIASNHLSNLDPMILGLASGRRLSYVAKESLFKNKFFSFVLYQVGAFPIKRNASDVRAIREALRRLKKGHRTVIFPEGTRKAKEGTKKTQAGIGLLAVKGNVPVVPAFIKGSDKVLPPGAKFFKGGRRKIRVVFAKPSHFSKQNTYLAVANQILRNVESLSRS